MQRDPLRLWITRNLHVIAFLGAYFVTVVAGNLIFASPWRYSSLAISNSSDRFLSYSNTFTIGYWALLLCPFVLTPLIVALVRRLSARTIERVARKVPEFSRVEIVVITAALFGFVIYRFWAADVMGLFSSGTDFRTSVEARFTIHERIGFVTMVPLQAILPLIAIYSLIRWIQSSELFWAAFTIVNTLVLSLLLILMNMKWPVLLFYIGIVMAIFVYTRTHAYLKTALGGVVVFIAFVLISTLVFRAAPPPLNAPGTHSVRSGGDRDAEPLAGREHAGNSRVGHAASEPAGSAIARASQHLVTATRVAPFYLPNLLVISLNRMAVPYPYYYHVFTEEGPACGGILSQATREPICRPSQLVYSWIFPDDHFQDKGTSPQGVHVSGYALGGWPVALFALLAASVILGLFAALPLDHSPAIGTATIVGAQAGYHFSQIPGEGVMFYDHGLFWVVLLFLVYLAWRRLTSPHQTIRRDDKADYLNGLA